METKAENTGDSLMGFDFGPLIQLFVDRGLDILFGVIILILGFWLSRIVSRTVVFTMEKRKVDPGVPAQYHLLRDHCRSGNRGGYKDGHSNHFICCGVGCCRPCHRSCAAGITFEFRVGYPIADLSSFQGQ